MSKSLLFWWLHQLELKTNPLYEKHKPVEHKQSVIVSNGPNKYDITPFLSNHPGGSKVLLNFSERDVQKQMRGIPHKHSKMAYSLLEDFRTEQNSTSDTLLTEEENIAKEKNEIESKLDWSKGMLWQVGGLGPDYERWLDFPTARRMRIFDSPFCEIFTRTSWFVVPMIWCPVVLIFLAISAHHFGRSLGLWAIPGFLTGLLLWSLNEYTLHRFIFHAMPPSRSPLLISLHFLLHGIHHKIPFDQGRLVMPPVLLIALSIPICTIVTIFLPSGIAYLLLAGLFTGYIMYDMCHYYLHHGHPNSSSYLHQLKQHHAHHHFIHHTKGFGVTSKIWDSYFGTELPMKS